MNSLRLLHLRSLTELRDQAVAWDELWYRSEVSAPVARAEMIAQWVEHFAPHEPFEALVVVEGNDFVAALPLVGGRKGKLLKVGQLPGNEWSVCGNLLWDESAGEEAIELLVRGLQKLPWPLLWLRGIPLDQPGWRVLQEQLTRSRLPFHAQAELSVGCVDIGADWEAYQAAWSGNHRRHMRKALKRAEAEGELQLVVQREFAGPQQVAEALHRGFEIEDRGWKGETGVGTSVLRVAGALEFFTRQAQQAAEWGELQLVFLEFNGRPIAFEYGWQAKGIYFTPKVGYDEEYSRLSPGQLLRYLLYEELFAGGETSSIDYYGPVSAATSKWLTRTYSAGRLAISNGGLLSRTILASYRAYRKLRKSSATKTAEAPVAAPTPEGELVS